MSQPRKSYDEVLSIVQDIKFLDRNFVLIKKGDGFLLQVQYYEADIRTGNEELQKARKWYISPYSTETEIVETAFAACKRSMEHVVGENFLYLGQRVYSPHFRIGARRDLCDREAFDQRG